MSGTFAFELVTPERVLVSGAMEAVLVPGTEGDFMVMAGHAPVVSTLRPGILEATAPGGKAQRLFVRSGLAEATAESMTVLAEHAVLLDGLAGDDLAELVSDSERLVADAADETERAYAQNALARLRAALPSAR